MTRGDLMPNARYQFNPGGMLSKNSSLSDLANKYWGGAWAVVTWPIIRNL